MWEGFVQVVEVRSVHLKWASLKWVNKAVLLPLYISKFPSGGNKNCFIGVRTKTVFYVYIPWPVLFHSQARNVMLENYEVFLLQTQIDLLVAGV